MTMLKYRVASYEAGHKLKEAIKRRAYKNDFITLKEVNNVLCPSVPSDPNEEKMGWRWSDLKGMNLYVRMCRFGEAVAQPYLYICEPTIDVHKITAGPEINVEMTDPEELKQGALNMEDKAFVDYLLKSLMDAMSYVDNKRKCMVWKKSRKKDVVAEEWPCWCFGWMPNRIVKSNGDTIDQTLFICEFQDGHVERINFDHIRFVEEWD